MEEQQFNPEGVKQKGISYLQLAVIISLIIISIGISIGLNIFQSMYIGMLKEKLDFKDAAFEEQHRTLNIVLDAQEQVAKAYKDNYEKSLARGR